MDDSDAEEFDNFLERVWGIKPKQEQENINYVEEKPKKRGRKPKEVIS